VGVEVVDSNIQKKKSDLAKQIEETSECYNIESAKRILEAEDKFDIELHRQKVKEKHRYNEIIIFSLFLLGKQMLQLTSFFFLLIGTNREQRHKAKAERRASKKKSG